GHVLAGVTVRGDGNLSSLPGGWEIARARHRGEPDGAAARLCGRCRMPRLMAAFSLVESLVALVVVGVGLLGLGQLTLTGLRESASALARTRAVYRVADMMERIRANPNAQDAFDCASYSTGPSERGCAPSGVPASNCTARELAEDDLARWQQSV